MIKNDHYVVHHKKEDDTSQHNLFCPSKHLMECIDHIKDMNQEEFRVYCVEVKPKLS